MEFVLAALFALIAGFGTAFSPCVLPVLPLVLSGGASGGRRRPLGIAVGLAGSFAFATLALAYVIAALGLPDDLLRTVAIVVLLVFGVSLAVRPLAARIEAWLSARVPARTQGTEGEGFGSGVVLGASLGLLYVPCAGPILAAVLTVSASQALSAQRLVTGLAYAVGTAGGVFLLSVAGRRLLARLRANSGRFQQALGLVMVAFAVLTLTGVDDRFRVEVANALPSWLVTPTEAIEKHAPGQRREPAAGLRDAGLAPELRGTQRWFNSQPLTLRSLRGRVVLIDFWTYTCINCIRTQPHLKAWDDRYRRDGLTIIGVHTPEFPFEKDAGNVQRAIRTAGLRYPVVQDNDFAVWNAFQNQYWPAKYLIDARGHLRYAHFGEGDYDQTEAAIRTLLGERGATAASVRAPAPSRRMSTPETYLGAARAQGFLQDPIRPGARDFGPLPSALPQDAFAFGGIWTVGLDEATAGLNARVALRFGARRVFLVLGSPGRRRQVQVRLQGEPPRTIVVDRHQLYTLVDLPRVESRELELRFEPGVRAYAFTFG
jgi:cytochrome c biogenesis protein CcdA/thiol-disulfide isomerase/thioredoxin